MPGSMSEAGGPSVSLSFANNFWGKEDAGVTPLLDRMHHAKVTGDELKSFYTARAEIEAEYARKLLSLAKKPLGSGEQGTLKMSFDVVRTEMESIGKAHQNVAQQMKSELDEAVSAFTGGMKERRKLVQGPIEKLLKTKSQQHAAHNKAKEKFERDCLKVKGYRAQGHMVMGQQERELNAKKEKAQLQVSTADKEYQDSVDALKETTGRWNREWKTVCDKFQDLEEERVDYMKSSLWTFANIASTVCVSDDASCEKIRLSLEDCDVEKDISNFIKECGTGQEIPEAPKYINFFREDLDDAASQASNEDYSVAQFQRHGNPAYRSSSPQPSAYGSAHDNGADPNETYNPNERNYQPILSTAATPRKPMNGATTSSPSYPTEQLQLTPYGEEYPSVPHNEYPPEGLTQYCRNDYQPQGSELSSNLSAGGRPSSRDSQSEYSNPTSFTSAEPSVLSVHPPKGNDSDLSVPEQETQKKRGGFFQNRSPFRRKSKGEKDMPARTDVTPSSRNTWGPASNATNTPSSRHQTPRYAREQASRDVVLPGERGSTSPEPVDPRANFQLNVGNNVFDVASPDSTNNSNRHQGIENDDSDPIAQALADLKGVTKQPSTRGFSAGNNSARSGHPKLADRSAPPPSYDPSAVSRLGAPQPAFTSKQMQQTTQKYVDQKRDIFSSDSTHRFNHNNGSHGFEPQQQPASARSTPSRSRVQSQAQTNSRATSPTPYRSTSPRPGAFFDENGQPRHPRATSPSPYANDNAPASQQSSSRARAQSFSPMKQPNAMWGSDVGAPGPNPGHSSRPGQRAGGYASQGGSPNQPQTRMPRATSPQPQFNHSQGDGREMGREQAGSGGYGMPQQPRGRPVSGGGVSIPTQQQQGHGRPTSSYGAPNGTNPQTGRSQGRSMPNAGPASGARQQQQQPQLTADGRPILHFSRALYTYDAQIPEELGFRKNDVVAVLRHQDDGWWEAEVCGRQGEMGLVPSNYLVTC